VAVTRFDVVLLDAIVAGTHGRVLGVLCLQSRPGVCSCLSPRRNKDFRRANVAEESIEQEEDAAARGDDEEDGDEAILFGGLGDGIAPGLVPGYDYSYEGPEGPECSRAGAMAFFMGLLSYVFTPGSAGTESSRWDDEDGAEGGGEGEDGQGVKPCRQCGLRGCGFPEGAAAM
jgi:hypothetical protein